MFVTAAGICQFRSTLTDSSVHEASAVADSKNRSVMKGKKKENKKKSFHADTEFAELKQLHCGKKINYHIVHNADRHQLHSARSFPHMSP